MIALQLITLSREPIPETNALIPLLHLLEDDIVPRRRRTASLGVEVENAARCFRPDLVLLVGGDAGIVAAECNLRVRAALRLGDDEFAGADGCALACRCAMVYRQCHVKGLGVHDGLRQGRA